MIHNRLTPTIVVVNNSGYTIERVIHGAKRRYNDVDAWDYQSLLHFFGAPKSARSYRATTYDELHAVLGDAQFQAGEQIQLLEVVLDKYDSPKNLLDLVDMSVAMGAVGMAKDDEANGRKRVQLDGTLSKTSLCQDFRR
jgi:pyruvate decarboxylase